MSANDCHLTTVGIEDLREKREEVQKQIRDEEAEKSKLQQDLQVLTKRLAHINDALARKVGWAVIQNLMHSLPAGISSSPKLLIRASLRRF